MSDSRIRLTIVGTADATSEVIVNELKRLGHVVRAQESKSKDELSQALSVDRPDILIYYAEAADVSLKDCQELVALADPPAPIIVLDDCDPLSNQQEFVKATLPAGEAKLVVQACLREYELLRSMRELVESKKLLEISEQRASLLMDKSDDAVGYVVDGMLMKTNEQFSDLLEFTDPKELEYLPFIDLIDETDRERVRLALHGIQVGDKNALDKINVLAMKQDGERVPVAVKFNRTVFEDEECVQITFTTRGGSGESQSTPEVGQRAIDIFTKHVDDWLKHTKTERADGAMLVMTVDSFQKLRDRYGLQKQDAFMNALLDVCGETLGSFENCRICYDAVGGLLTNTSIDQAKAMAAEIVKKVADCVVDIGEKTSHFTTTVAVLPLNQWVTQTAMHLVNDGLKLCGNSQGNEVVTKDRDVAKKSAGDGEDSGADPFEMLVQTRLRILFEPVIGLKGTPGQYYETHIDIKNWHTGEITAEELIAAEDEKHDETRMDRWLLIEATKLLAAVRKNDTDARLLLNMTSNGIHDANFVKWLRIAVKAAGVPANALALQIRELSLSEHVTRASEFVEAVKELGLDVSVSAAGEYHNSASFLKQLQPTFIQTRYSIDDQQHRDALSQLVKNAQKEKFKVIVPGVNSVASMTSLWTMGPDYVKGPYFSAPKPEMDYDFGDDS